jgi:hypothetical protein
MDILQWLKNRWKSEQIHNTYFRIPEANIQTETGAAFAPTPVKAGEQYFQIWLAEMFLRYRREWGSSWYPTVVATVQLKFGNQSQEISHVAGQSTLKNVKITDVDCVAMNHALTTILPFNGGTIAIEAALLAMQGKSDINSLIKVLSSFSKLLVVPQLSAALAVAQPLADGLAELVGATDAHPELRLQDAWGGADSGNQHILTAGYYVVVAAQAGALKPEELFVRGGRLYRGDRAITGYDYMLFRVDVNCTRDDWDSLASIDGPYQEAIKLLEDSLKSDDLDLQKGMRAEAEKRIAAARVAAFRAPELSRVVGKNQVLDALDKRWKEAKKQLGLGAFANEFPRTLAAAMRNPISITEAIERGEQSEQDLWNDAPI